MVKVKMITALGIDLGEIDLPKKMEKDFIKSYFKTKIVENYYLFINGKEITDGKNYNPFYHKFGKGMKLFNERTKKLL